jgi:pilus assembly protein CpaC
MARHDRYVGIGLIIAAIALVAAVDRTGRADASPRTIDLAGGIVCELPASEASADEGARPSPIVRTPAPSARALTGYRSSNAVRGAKAGGKEVALASVNADAAAGTPSDGVALITQGLRDGKLSLLMNKSTVLSTRSAYKRVSVGAPDVADINAIGPNSLLVTAKKPGTTQLIVWDDDDRSQVVDLAVQADVGTLQDQLKQMFPGSKIDVTVVGGGQIVLKGRVSSVLEAEQAVQLAQPFAPKVLNFLEVSGGQQVMLQVRFAEVSRSATTALGVNLGYTDGRGLGGSNIGQVSPLSIVEGEQKGSILLGVPPPTPAVSVFGRALVGDEAIWYFISALRSNNLLRVLAEPNLTTTSGNEASFIAGGEFPIPVTQGGGTGAGGTAITIEYRTFGVKLRFVPVVLGDGRIRLKCAPEVSDLDFTTAVKFNGFVIPGLTQRKLETTVEMHEGQTLALAGLLNNNVSSSKDVTPLLGDMPVIGALFRSVRYQRKETELVVIVTPRVVEAMNPAQVPLLPGEKWHHPTEGDLFWRRDIGSPGGDPKRAVKATPEPHSQGEAPPRFKGEYGYTPVEGDDE